MQSNVIGQSTHITLLERLAAGGDGAWRDFHWRYGELIKNFCRARGVQAADIDDVTQDVLVSLAKAMPGFRYDPSKGTFRGYLRTITVHAIIKRSRQNPMRRDLEKVEPPDDGSDEATDRLWETQWRRYHLQRAMQSLAGEVAERDLEAFDRYAVVGEDPGTIARELGISMDNLYQIKSRVTRRLATLIQQQVAEEG